MENVDNAMETMEHKIENRQHQIDTIENITIMESNTVDREEYRGSTVELERDRFEHSRDTVEHAIETVEQAIDIVENVRDAMEQTEDDVTEQHNIVNEEKLDIKEVIKKETVREMMSLDREAVLSYLECPVCILPPRISPIYQCPTGHLVCCECQPSLARCPICNVRFRKILTRDFFAEKLLELVERRCRYEVDGCDFISRVSLDLVEHESTCHWKQTLQVRRRKRKESSSNQEDNNDNGADGDEAEEGENEEEEALEEDLLDEEDDDDVIEVEDVFVSNFAFIVVLLRAYMLEFAKYDPADTDNFFFEYFLLFLLCVWLYHVWLENGFHILLDETSPYIAGWFAATVLGLMLLKSLYLGSGDGEPEQAEVITRPCIGE